VSANSVQIIQVDAFTAEAFGGNPAAVCLLREERSAEWMQVVGAEMNLSETAFVLRRGDGDFSLRWFTPTVEVPLCGHATLASAHVLWEEELASPDESITFHTQSGRLSARREADWICLDFPALALEVCAAPAGLGEALGCCPVSVQRNAFPTYLVEVDSEKTVRELQPDFAQLRDTGCGTCIVTARGKSGVCDFVSRFFGPGVGIDEDPVTGAAHCSLGPFWADRLGKTELIGHQVSKRGGAVRVRVRGDRVDLLGQAVTVMRGELLA
jgi:PhzF family phenazine biosynthesis protein